MDLISLLYVSQAAQALDEGGVNPIVDIAMSRNQTLDVTGALLFTGPHFAQVLEGPRAGVEELMVSIERDERHFDVDVLEVADIRERRFPQWSLAYAGPSLFVERHLRTLVEQREEHSSPRRLIDLMQEFVSPRQRQA